jgi:hypothetical protein
LLLNYNLPAYPFPQPQLEGDAVQNMALSILQNNLGVTNSTCSYTDYPDHPLNFFPKDLRSTAHFGGVRGAGDGMWLSRKILKSYMLK